jgi:hypothetical protein
MLDKQFEEMLLVNPAQMHAHLLEEFRGQPFPEQSQTSIMEKDIDLPLARELLNRWIVRFSEDKVEWKDKALFRSLNMANEAARIPALTAATFYDVGRSLALWVSAYEILAHPGGTGQSNFHTVSTRLESVRWDNAKLSAAAHSVGKPPNRSSSRLGYAKRSMTFAMTFFTATMLRHRLSCLTEKPSLTSPRASTGWHSPGFSICISTYRCRQLRMQMQLARLLLNE